MKRHRRSVTVAKLIGLSWVMLASALWTRRSDAAPYAYIPCSNGTYVIDTVTDTVVTTIPTGGGQVAVVAPGGAYVYLGNFNDTVSFVETTSHSVVDTASGDLSGYIAVDPTGSLLYVGNPLPPTLSVVSTATGLVVDTVPGVTNPWGVAVHPAGAKVYLAESTLAQVQVIGTVTNTIIDSINVGSAPGMVTIHPSGSPVYVSNNASATVTVIDPATDTVIDTIPTGSGPFGMAVHPDGTRMYVCNMFDDTVSVVDTATNSAIATISVGDLPFGAAVHPDGSRLYVANRFGDTVSVIDTATDAELYQIAVGNFPSSVAITGGQSTASTVAAATGTLSVSVSSGITGTLDFAPGAVSIFGTSVDFDSALAGVPMNVTINVTSGVPGGFNISFGANSTSLPSFSLNGPGQASSSGSGFQLTVALGPPTGTLVPSGPIYTLVANLLPAGPGAFSGPFTMGATLAANTPAVPGATVPVTANVKLCPFGLPLELPVTVTYTDVTVAGGTTVTGTCQTPASIPPNIRLDAGSVMFFFDVATTASYTAPIQICGTYPDANNDGFVDLIGVDELTLTLLHDAGTGFQTANDITIDPLNNRICGKVDSLSPFLIAAAGVPKGFVPPDADARKCENKLLKMSANLLKGILKCNRKAAEAVFKSRTFDAATCEADARATYNAKVADLAGCPTCLLANAVSVGDAAENTAEALQSGLYCAGAAPLGGDDFGFVPADDGAGFCAKQQGKDAAKLSKKLGKCYRKHADAAFKSQAFDLDACLTEANSAYDTAVGALAGCPACATANGPGTRNQIERFSVGILSDVYCAGTTELP